MENVSELISEAVLRSGRLAVVLGSLILFCWAEVSGVSQKVASTDFGCWKILIFYGFDKSWRCWWKWRGTISANFRIWKGLGMIAGVLALATGIGDRGGFWTVTVEVFKFSEEELIFVRIVWSLYIWSSIYKIGVYFRNWWNRGYINICSWIWRWDSFQKN